MTIIENYYHDLTKEGREKKKKRDLYDMMDALQNRVTQ